MTKAGRSISTILYIIIFIVITIVSGAVAKQLTSSIDFTDADYITVQPGDTLWHIADIYTKPNGDVRKTVYEIRKMNDLDSALLKPGDVLLVPTNS